jgi:CheY-like chemotaxis protein
MPVILIVEDAEACMSTLEIALAAVAGHEVRTAASAEEAMGILAEEPAAVVVTDLHLPGMSGFELIERIHAWPKAERPIIVVISGNTDPETPQRVLKMGADAFFAKPYSPGEVRRTLEKFIHAA